MKNNKVNSSNQNLLEDRLFYLKEQDKNPIIQSIKKPLSEHKNIIFAYLLGSFIEENHFRDIDVAVFLNPDSFPKYNFIFEADLAENLMSNLSERYPIDVRTLNSSSLGFKYQAIQGRLIMDNDPEARCQVIEYILSRYLDLKPILKHHTRELFDLENKSRQASS